MRTILIAATIVASVPAYAGMTCTRTGQFTNCYNNSTGETFTGTRMGQFDNWQQTSPGFRNDNPNWLQNRQTCSWVGNFYVCN